MYLSTGFSSDFHPKSIGLSDDPRLEGLWLTGGSVAAAKASGFRGYWIASTALGGLTSALGITLFFAVSS
ncbi:hypothetical protein [Phormidium sp. FACHB-1136]|jgi:hypothetical protein|uniref:hypothetical protein n=1 Tax=Phormidium sp. FACHB-1136 TaxID=2692848 RepID=UPI0016882379|nr:hypothetical protein [Phormidium sp. FACHB-1136]MBD2427476.1 hypothetical protein [Phormidium sp. FACHB-1136]